MTQRNVLGGELEECGTDPMTGFTRTGCCIAVPEGGSMHTVCTVVTADFLEHQREIGNDLLTPVPAYGFPGLQPGDRWCVVAPRWFASYEAGRAARGGSRGGVFLRGDPWLARRARCAARRRSRG